ncbi:MAG: guanylate kinase [Hungatella sp.]
MKDQGILTVVSGFSGVGKGTLMRELLTAMTTMHCLFSATTRSPREGEVHGREYFFATREEFELMIQQEKLIEYAEYVGNYYGTPKEYVLSQLTDGKDVILEIEIQGAQKIRQQFPEALLLFVVAPTAEELKRRLTGRGTESADVIEARLRRAAEESEGMDQYDYLLVNDTVENCVERMHQLIQSQHRKVSNCRNFIRDMKEELKQF